MRGLRIAASALAVFAGVAVGPATGVVAAAFPALTFVTVATGLSQPTQVASTAAMPGRLFVDGAHRAGQASRRDDGCDWGNAIPRPDRCCEQHRRRAGTPGDCLRARLRAVASNLRHLHGCDWGSDPEASDSRQCGCCGRRFTGGGGSACRSAPRGFEPQRRESGFRFVGSSPVGNRRRRKRRRSRGQRTKHQRAAGKSAPTRCERGMRSAQVLHTCVEPVCRWRWPPGGLAVGAQESFAYDG